MTYAPVIVFTYNRADKAQIVLESLDHNLLAPETDLYIFNDAGNDLKTGDHEKVAKVREYLEVFRTNNHFKKVQITMAPEHKGLAASVISGVTDIIHRYGKVIVTEDDLVSHVNYLNYANDALNYYKDNPQIWSISSYNLPMKTCEGRKDVYFTYRGCSYGWATWADRWDTVDWTMADYKRLPWDLKYMKKLNHAGRDLFVMLRDQKRGIIDSWAVRWVFAQVKNELLTVYPGQSLIHNIGFDGSGAHGVVEENTDNETYTTLGPVPYHFTDVKMEKELLNEFATFYEDPWFHTVQKF